jgi:hypothetical protein
MNNQSMDISNCHSHSSAKAWCQCQCKGDCHWFSFSILNIAAGSTCYTVLELEIEICWNEVITYQLEHDNYLLAGLYYDMGIITDHNIISVGIVIGTKCNP